MACRVLGSDHSDHPNDAWLFNTGAQEPRSAEQAPAGTAEAAEAGAGNLGSAGPAAQSSAAQSGAGGRESGEGRAPSQSHDSEGQADTGPTPPTPATASAWSRGADKLILLAGQDAATQTSGARSGGSVRGGVAPAGSQKRAGAPGALGGRPAAALRVSGGQSLLALPGLRLPAARQRCPRGQLTEGHSITGVRCACCKCKSKRLAPCVPSRTWHAAARHSHAWTDGIDSVLSPGEGSCW